MQNEEKTRKEFSKKVGLLVKEMRIINRIMEELNLPEQILEKQIKNFGNASHVILPKEYTNKKAKIIIKK